MPQSLAPQAADVGIIDGQRSFADVVHPVHGAQQRGLTCARTSNDGDKLTVLDRQIYIVQTNCAIGINFRYMVKYDHEVHLVS